MHVVNCGENHFVITCAPSQFAFIFLVIKLATWLGADSHWLCRYQSKTNYNTLYMITASNNLSKGLYSSELSETNSIIHVGTVNCNWITSKTYFTVNY